MSGLAEIPRIALNATEAAIALRITAGQLHRLTTSRVLPHFRVCGMLMYSARSLAAWVELEIDLEEQAIS